MPLVLLVYSLATDTAQNCISLHSSGVKLTELFNGLQYHYVLLMAISSPTFRGPGLANIVNQMVIDTATNLKQPSCMLPTTY
jgi:hypothetical protein